MIEIYKRMAERQAKNDMPVKEGHRLTLDAQRQQPEKC
jgi:hypothetical protein